MNRIAQQLPVGNSVPKVNEEVAVGEDLEFQRAWWRFEGIAWGLFTLIIALDLAGAFGRGPLAHARLASTDGSLEVRYDRIQRTGTSSLMTIELNAPSVQGDRATLFVSDELVRHLGAQRIIPQPAMTRVGGGGLTYSFLAAGQPVIVRIELEPPAPGVFRFVLSGGAGNSVSGKAWVVP
jgi:hypothetical protein